MADDINKMRIHSMSFSEDEHLILGEFIDRYSGTNQNDYLKFNYPGLWEFLNRMSYVVSHGTEEGWNDCE